MSLQVLLSMHGAVVLLVLMNLISYWFYAQDKEAAQLGNQRVPENTLHIVSFLGGWPAALAWLSNVCDIKHKNNRFVKFISVLIVFNILTDFMDNFTI